MKENKVLYIGVIVLMLVSIVNTIFLADANHIIKEQKIKIFEAELRVYEHLNSIAWDSTVSINKQHVTGIKRYYKCDNVKKELEKYMK